MTKGKEFTGRIVQRSSSSSARKRSFMKRLVIAALALGTAAVILRPRKAH